MEYLNVLTLFTFSMILDPLIQMVLLGYHPEPLFNCLLDLFASPYPDYLPKDEEQPRKVRLCCIVLRCRVFLVKQMINLIYFVRKTY